MSLPPPSEKLNTLMQCLPDAPFKTHMAEEVKAYGQACREAALLDAMNATLPFGKVGIVIASAIRSLK